MQESESSCAWVIRTPCISTVVLFHTQQFASIPKLTTLLSFLVGTVALLLQDHRTMLP